MKSKKKFHSLVSKTTLIIAIVGLSLTLILSFLCPTLFYHLAEDEFTTYTTNAIRECAVRLSYVLTSHKPTLDLRSNEDMQNLLGAYYDLTEANNKSAASELSKPEIKEKLDTYAINASYNVNGSSEDLDYDYDQYNFNGSINANNYTVILTSRGDYFCSPREEELAKAFLDQHILDQYTYDEETELFTSEQYFVDKNGNSYPPVLDMYVHGKTSSFFCTVGLFRIGDVNCCVVSFMAFSGILQQFEALENMGIQDYTLVCGSHVLYSHLDQSVFNNEVFDPDSYSQNLYDVFPIQSGDGTKFFTLASYPSEQLYIDVYVTKSELMAPYTRFFHVLRICLVLTILLITGIFSLIFRLSLKRLSLLDSHMSRISNGDFDSIPEDTTNDEIGNITRTTNQMIASIRSNLEEKIASEKQEKELQYGLLVSAMDPHFIYNTLDTVTFLAAMGKCDDIILVNNALIGTLKDRIRMKNLKIYDSVENEKKVLEQYMIIENYLCATPIDYTFEAGEDLAEVQIPKNILQPLVENAIKHGLMTNKDITRQYNKAGKIVVSVFRSADPAHPDRLILKVADNGVGMTEEKKAYYLSRPSKENIDPDHIGLHNMQLRLAYLYQDRFQFEIETPEEGGTVLRITIPAEK